MRTVARLMQAAAQASTRALPSPPHVAPRHRLVLGPRPPSQRPPPQAARGVAALSGSGADGGYYIGDVSVKGSESGPLAGLAAVVKDSYDVAGHRTGNGSPTWRETHPLAERNAWAVQALLDAGASVVGKNRMVEMAYSLDGDNAHYGTPTNPACPGRLPGGSSSGTAAAVAAGEAEIGLGGDTGGSVRVPASYCGTLGFRPTHGRVSLEGSCPLAPSFDTVGWFARDPAVLRRVGGVLLGPAARRQLALQRWLVGKDAFELADPATTQAIYGALSPRIEAVTGLLGAPQEVAVGRVEGGLESWRDIFRVHQAFEVWQTHGAWVQRHQPAFGPGIRERFEMASKVSRGEFEAAHRRRAAVTAYMLELLGEDAVLAVPSAPCPAPRLDSTPAELDAMRPRLLSLTCIAGLAGLPQVSIPIATVDGCPVGLGLIGPPGSDEVLLQLTESLMEILQP